MSRLKSMRYVRPILESALMGAAAVLATLTAVVSPTAHAQEARRGPARTSTSWLAGGTCTVLDVRLVFPDSVIASVPWKRCGPAHLVVVGRPKLTFDGQGRYTQWRRLSISVAVRNEGSDRLASPVELRTDSITPFWRGQQLPQDVTPVFLSHPTLWPEYVSSPRAVLGTLGDSTDGLAPGERSRSLEFTFVPLPQADHFRLWVDLRRRGAQRPYPSTRAVPRPPIDHNPLGADVDAFIANAHLPLERERRALFRIADRDLLFFDVSFGTAQDCEAGCFYSRALGLKVGRKIGWLDLQHYVSDTAQRVKWSRSAFALSTEDAYLFSLPFLDTVTAVFGRYSYVASRISDMVLAHPDVSRGTLARLAERLADVPDERIANSLLEHPKVKGDAELLLMLANLPTIRANWVIRRRAGEALASHASALIANPSTPARTLFLLASGVSLDARPGDSLTSRLAEHPNARGNLAIQIVLHASAYWRSPEQWSRVMSLIRTSPRIRAELDKHFRIDESQVEKSGTGAALLADPEAGHNPDVLLALANRSPDMLVAWEAARRLPPTALVRLNLSFRPMLPTRAR